MIVHDGEETRRALRGEVGRNGVELMQQGPETKIGCGML